jgi:hypothetical protein
MFIVQFATIAFFVTGSTGMTIKFFQFPNCVQQNRVAYAFSDICTSLTNYYDLALTTCDIDKKGNGTITATYFNHPFPSGQYLPPMCNASIYRKITATGWGVCTNSTDSLSSFMFGDESEEIQCASSQNQGAFLFSKPFAATVCAALQYTIVNSISITGRNGCMYSQDAGGIIKSFYLNNEQKAVSLTSYNDNVCGNTSSIRYSFPSMPLDGSCVNSTGGTYVNYISGALPCNPYPPVQRN